MQTETFLKYARVLTIGTLLLSAAILVVKYVAFPEAHLEWFQALPVVIVFYAVGLWSGYRLLKARKDGNNNFVRAFMLTSVIKLMIYFTLLFVFLWQWKEYAPEVIVLFGACYIVYAAIERLNLMKALR
ncbi:MAG: hypothetical protein H6585_15215 [Flavobacteriales bacterium]|nr:hypothetical protein [Flavobacteriales bacterium]MCB9449680.1 hypothetical protein [Flavobacteriales bacterium]